MSIKSNIEEKTEGYMLLFRGKDWDEGLAPEELKRVIDRFAAWSDGLTKAGKIKGGQALSRSGTVLGRGGKAVADGPFAETKETVGGYLVLNVGSLAEAVEVAKTFPGLDFDVTIEIRPILDECPCFKRVRERFGLTPAGYNNALGFKRAA